MSSALALTRDQLISALAPLPEKTIGEVLPKHLPYLALQGLAMEPSTPASVARQIILKRIGREIGKMERRHWSFDMNRLIALQLFALALE